jgi:predicted RNase H-like HicB family nuclease
MLVVQASTMDQPEIAFTAVFLRGRHGYTGFVEELPGVNAQGQTIDEARDNLRRLAEVVFEEERAQSAELLAGKDVVREQFRISLARR